MLQSRPPERTLTKCLVTFLQSAPLGPLARDAVRRLKQSDDADLRLKAFCNEPWRFDLALRRLGTLDGVVIEELWSSLESTTGLIVGAFGSDWPGRRVEADVLSHRRAILRGDPRLTAPTRESLSLSIDVLALDEADLMSLRDAAVRTVGDVEGWPDARFEGAPFARPGFVRDLELALRSKAGVSRTRSGGLFRALLAKVDDWSEIPDDIPDVDATDLRLDLLIQDIVQRPMTWRPLADRGIVTVRDAVVRSPGELRRVPAMGRIALEDIDSSLRRIGLPSFVRIVESGPPSAPTVRELTLDQLHVEAFARLGPEDREAVERHYGLGRSTPESLTDIARSFGVSVHRIRFRIRTALRRLRLTPLARQVGDPLQGMRRELFLQASEGATTLSAKDLRSAPMRIDGRWRLFIDLGHGRLESWLDAHFERAGDVWGL
jgi:hypothetical protein